MHEYNNTAALLMSGDNISLMGSVECPNEPKIMFYCNCNTTNILQKMDIIHQTVQYSSMSNRGRNQELENEIYEFMQRIIEFHRKNYLFG